MRPEDRGDSMSGGEPVPMGRDAGGDSLRDSRDSLREGGDSAELVHVEVSDEMSSALSSLSEWRGGPTRLWESALASCEASPAGEASGGEGVDADEGGTGAGLVVVGGGVWGWTLRHRGVSSFLASAAAVVIAATAWYAGFNWRGWTLESDDARLGESVLAMSPPTTGMFASEASPEVFASLQSRLEDDLGLGTEFARSNSNREFERVPAGPIVASQSDNDSMRDDAALVLGSTATSREFGAAPAGPRREGTDDQAGLFSMSAEPLRARASRADIVQQSLRQRQVNLVVAYNPEQPLSAAFDVVSQRLLPGESIEIRSIDANAVLNADELIRKQSQQAGQMLREPIELAATINLQNSRAGDVLREIEQIGAVVQREESVTDLETELAVVESRLLMQQNIAERIRSVDMDRRRMDVRPEREGGRDEPDTSQEVASIDLAELERFVETIRRISELSAERNRILNKQHLTNINIRLVPMQQQPTPSVEYNTDDK